MKNTRVLSFGEIMLRLRAPGHERFFQSNMMEATFGGSEANVAISLANYGMKSDYFTILPNNAIADEAIKELRKFGVGTDTIQRGEGRMGIYFLENGANKLPSKVVYDRAYSSMTMAAPGSVNWNDILKGCGWLHISGITPAISESAMQLSLDSVKAAREKGLTVSLDLNYRKNLWKYGKEAGEVMKELTKYADVVVASADEIETVLGIKASHSEDPERFKLLGDEVLKAYPNIKTIGITLVDTLSSESLDLAACLNDRKHFYVSKQYQIRDVVDFVGGGDSFAAGIIYGLNNYKSKQDALEFAVAAAVLKYSILGDYNRVGLADVESLAFGSGSAGMQR